MQRTRVYVYKSRNKWKVEIRRPSGRTTETVATREEAEAIAEEARRIAGGETVNCAILVDEYVADLKRQGLRESHHSTVQYRLTKALGDLLLVELSPRRCEALYEEMQTYWAVDTHRGALSVLKTWGKWLVRKQECTETDTWPGVSQEPVPVELPAWAYDDLDTDLYIDGEKVSL